VRDACEATYLLAKRGTPGETYHISTRNACSIARLVEMIGARYEVVPDRLGKDEAYLLDSEKVRALVWQDTITLKDGLCELSR
jgi:dTDP-glucose 4,6-dehydratase